MTSNLIIFFIIREKGWKNTSFHCIKSEEVKETRSKDEDIGREKNLTKLVEKATDQ